MGDRGMSVGGGLDHDFDRLFDHCSFGDVDEQAVFEVGGVQGHEGIVLVAGVARQVLLDRRFG